MKATFENSVNVLVKAFFNGTLQLGNCAACAVGNIIADSLGYTYKDHKFHSDGNFTEKIWNEEPYPNSSNNGWFKIMFSDESIGPETHHQILASGYSVDDLRKIEHAFETGLGCRNNKYQTSEWQFNGLMAVVDLLAEIHGIDLTQKENAKAMFVKS